MRFSALAILLCGASRMLGDEPYTTSLGFTGAADGRSLSFQVTSEVASKTPAWPPESENPPLSPRRAQEIARKGMQELVADPKAWRLDEIRLVDMGDHLHWIYVVHFMRVSGNDPARLSPDYLDTVVLMDGTFVKPTLVKSDQRGAVP